MTHRGGRGSVRGVHGLDRGVSSGPEFATAGYGRTMRRAQSHLETNAKAQYDCIKAFSETDFTEDLRQIDVPVLVQHGDDDQIVPIGDSAHLSIKLLRHGT